MIGTLYIVATPIGNLEDITFRAVDTLKSVDVVLCEDTRVTKVLLNKYDIDTPTLSYHQHSSNEKVMEILELLESGKNLALVTDAGTPGISDPGNKLVHSVISTGSRLLQKAGGVEKSLIETQKRDSSIPLRSTRNDKEEINIIPIPGASAVITALSVSGFPTDKFLFLGFPPHKKKRKKYFEELSESNFTVAFYESSHRIKKALNNLSEVLDPEQEICVCRELTKKFETIYRGTIQEIIEMDISEKGEFVVVVNKK